MKHWKEWDASVELAMIVREDACVSENDAATRIGAAHLAYAEQVHGNDARVVRGDSRGVLRCDALVTDDPALTLCVRWADCQNFVIAASHRGVLGVVHAGWRGIASRVLPSLYDVLRHTWGIAPGETHVYAGPSLCTACAEFTDPLAELPGHMHPFVYGNTVDLRAAADAQLDTLGVPRERRMRSSDCTRCMSGAYWSARAAKRDGGKSCGRNFLLARFC